MPRRRKRGRKKKFKLKFNIRTETIRSTAAIILLALSGVILISFIFRGYSVNSTIQEYLRLGFGLTHLLLVPIFFISGLLLTTSIRWKFVELRIVIGLCLLLLSLSSMLHVFYSDEKSYQIASAGSGGGLFGHKIAMLLDGTLSVYGAALVLLSLVVLSIVLTFDRSPDEIILGAKEGLKRAGLLKEKDENTDTSTKEESKEDEGEDFDISYGFNVFDKESGESQTEIHPEKPSFEIIPSMSEPQTGSPAVFGVDEGTITSLATPSLPYTDKVWELPPIDLLNDPPNTPVDRGDVNQRAKIIEKTLESFGIKAKVRDMKFGPSVTQYALGAESGTKIAKISNLQYDLALALASPTGSVRIEAPIPGKSLIGIEVPNNIREVVNFKDMLTSDPMKNMKSRIAISLGLDVGGRPMVYDIAKMPHLLIAGATGSGKSVFIHSLMSTILYRASPQEVKFLLVDPKRVELKHYSDIPHLLAPVITDTDKAAATFKWLVHEMERRYKLLEGAKVRNIEAYNEKSGFQAMSYILLVVDELAEIMVADPAAVEKSIIRLAQLARATGIHLILALQRPSTNVITGLIKANITCRIAFNVTSQVDSRVIIDQPGAEKLLGNGDMLFIPPDDSKPVRIQSAMVTDKEISNLVGFLKNQGVEPEYNDDIFEVRDGSRSVIAGGDATDPLFNEAVEIVVGENKGSASLLQRRLSIGYSRAARILDELETKGIVGPAKGSKPRDVLIKRDTGDDFDSRQEFY
jgi:DNA segregation ATPase FtsK/SpoIIIE, S-DNA-T family